MPRRTLLLVVSALGLAATALLAFGWSSGDQKTRALPREVEITDYQGVALGSTPW